MPRKSRNKASNFKSVISDGVDIFLHKNMERIQDVIGLVNNRVVVGETVVVGGK
jgi:hypothetical protein